MGDRATILAEKSPILLLRMYCNSSRSVVCLKQDYLSTVQKRNAHPVRVDSTTVVARSPHKAEHDHSQESLDVELQIGAAPMDGHRIKVYTCECQSGAPQIIVMRKHLSVPAQNVKERKNG